MKTKKQKITLAKTEAFKSSGSMRVFFLQADWAAHTHTLTTTMTGGQYDLDENLLDRAKHKPTLA